MTVIDIHWNIKRVICCKADIDFEEMKVQQVQFIQMKYDKNGEYEGRKERIKEEVKKQNMKWIIQTSTFELIMHFYIVSGLTISRYFICFVFRDEEDNDSN